MHFKVPEWGFRGGTVQDYYPFGMIEPGRQYAILGDSAYRFGFNGKEHDDNIYGKDNSYDYGARFYDPRLGRFISVDPIFAQYPMLSTYQFASNRPIDGIDLNGLEYYHVFIQEDQNGHKTEISRIDHTNTENGYGVLGPGIEYTTYKMVGNKNTTHSNELRTNIYGIYGRPNNPTINGEKTQTSKNEDMSFSPINELDKDMKEHDQKYNDLGAVGENDAENNILTIDADKILIKKAQEVIKKYKIIGKSGTDEVTKKPVTIQEYGAAKITIKYFSHIVNNKRKKLNEQK